MRKMKNLFSRIIGKCKSPEFSIIGRFDNKNRVIWCKISGDLQNSGDL